ncbi:MAG: hypothetical protein ACUVX9_01510 [Anaerolineae bacterium]
MAVDLLAHMAPWLGGLAGMVAVTYVARQWRAYARLRQHWARLRDLRAGQRQVYRSLESLREYSEFLLSRVPAAARPAPYDEGDRQLLAAGAQLRARLEALRSEVRPLMTGACPAWSPLALITGRYASLEREILQQVALARRLRQEIAQTQALADELETLLSRQAHKPQDVQQAFADVLALAEALIEEVELQQRSGIEGLEMLRQQAQELRSSAEAWVLRLGQAIGAVAAEAAIEGEALRPELLARIMALYGQVGGIAGVQNQALRALERLATAMNSIAERAAALRPPLRQVLEAGLGDMRQRQQALQARSATHEPASYQMVAQEAWALVAEARAYDRDLQQLTGRDLRLSETVAESERAVNSLQDAVAAEERRFPVALDIIRSGIARLQNLVAQMHALRDAVGCRPGARPADVLDTLAGAENLSGIVEREGAQLKAQLEIWQAQRATCEGVIAQWREGLGMEAALVHIVQELQAYHRSNWSQLPEGWHADWRARWADLRADLEGALTTLDSGQLVQSSAGEWLATMAALGARWQGLSREAAHAKMVLGRAQAAERQVLEGLAALRLDIDAAATALADLPAGSPLAGELGAAARSILSSYDDLMARARDRSTADYRRLREEGLAQIHEQLAIYRLTHERLLGEDRASLRAPLTALWERWEPLSERLARAVPATQVDYASLSRRWEVLVNNARRDVVSMGQLVALKAEVDALSRDVAQAEADFAAERERVHEAEVELAKERRSALQLRECLPNLLSHPHPQVVDEEWARSTRAWQKAEFAVRHLEPRRSLSGYLERVAEAAKAYRDARERARSAMVRLLRYAILEDPEGMREACLPMGDGWRQLGMTAREGHIRNLLADLEQAGQVGRLAERVSAFLLRRTGAAG